MENPKRNHRGHGVHIRFFRWTKEKMTGADAFEIMFGEKSNEYPKEMKDDFVALFEQLKETHAKIHEGRKTFMDKWKEYMPEEQDLPHGGHFGGGHPFGPGAEGCGEHGERFPRRGRGFGW